MKARFVKQQLEITRSWKQIQSLLDGGQFTFSVLESGVGYTTADSILLRNDILPPSESTYYDHLDEVCDAIISFTDECIKQQYQKMSPNTVISIDGSWDHVRHAKHCIVAVIDQTQKKNCSLWISWKDDAAGDAAYQGRINNIERECVRNLIEHLSADKRIVGDCHDNNSAISNLVKDEGYLSYHGISRPESYVKKFCQKI